MAQDMSVVHAHITQGQISKSGSSRLLLQNEFSTFDIKFTWHLTSPTHCSRQQAEKATSFVCSCLPCEQFSHAHTASLIIMDTSVFIKHKRNKHKACCISQDNIATIGNQLWQNVASHRDSLDIHLLIQTGNQSNKILFKQASTSSRLNSTKVNSWHLERVTTTLRYWPCGNCWWTLEITCSKAILKLGQWKRWWLALRGFVTWLWHKTDPQHRDHVVQGVPPLQCWENNMKSTKSPQNTINR